MGLQLGSYLTGPFLGQFAKGLKSGFNVFINSLISWFCSASTLTRRLGYIIIANQQQASFSDLGLFFSHFSLLIKGKRGHARKNKKNRQKKFLTLFSPCDKKQSEKQKDNLIRKGDS
jgi:hypothetical protein